MKFPPWLQTLFGLLAAILAAALVHELLEASSLRTLAAGSTLLPLEWLSLSLEVLTALGAFVVAAGSAGVGLLTRLLLGAADWLQESNSPEKPPLAKTRRRRKA